MTQGHAPSGSLQSPPGEDDQPPCRILVVEDEYIVAFDLCAELASMGVEVVGPAATVDHALHLAASTEPLHGALLDVNVGGRDVFPVADVLLGRNIPFVFATGYEKSMLPAAYRSMVQIDKPVLMSELGRAIRTLCSGVCRTVAAPDTT